MKPVKFLLLIMLKTLVVPSARSEQHAEYIHLTQPAVLEEETHRELISGGSPMDHVSLAELVLQQREDMARLSSQFLQLQQSHHRLQDHVQDQSQELQELKDSRRADREVLDRQTWEITGLRRGMEEQTREIQELLGKNQHLEDSVQHQQQQLLHLVDSMQQHQQQVIHLEDSMQQQQHILHLEDSMKRQQSDLARLMDRQESDLPRHVSQLNEQSHQPSGQEQAMAEDRPFPQWKANTSSVHHGLLADQKKRADDTSPLEPIISQMTQQLTQVTSDIEALKNTNDRQDATRGTAYVRWGHTACPNSAEVVYSGILTGSLHTATGGPANHLCMTDHPVYDNHALPTSNSHTSIYGSEYNICPEPQCETTPACAVCRVARASTVMIPGTNTCTPGWTLEYSGYIMGGLQKHTASSEYICVDSSLEYVPGTEENEEQNTIFYTKVQCGSLPCPPYQTEKAVTCVVCSK